MSGELSATEKLRKYFDGMTVKKSSVQSLFSSLSLPGFIRDWFLKRYADKNGEVNPNFISEKIKEILPKKEEWNGILDRIMKGDSAKFLAKIKVKISIRSGEVAFELPDFSLSSDDTSIPKPVWERTKQSFLRSDEDVWGIVELSYRVASSRREKNMIILESFTPFCPYKADLEYYKQGRAQFELGEWIDVLLGAIDYNPAGFSTEEEKLSMLTRLLPFVEKRLNLIELAPKGTGKSYLFSRISKRSWLVSGGVMTRAKMFYDMKLKEQGIVSFYDLVALDEVSTIKFPDESEMQGALKGYLESGAYTVGNVSGSGQAGVVLLGNIDIDSMNTNVNMFESLPAIFGDSALIDRFHGFLEGWRIPRMNEKMKSSDWAFNTEYFSEIMNALRSDVCATAIVNELVCAPDSADTRDVTAVKRLTSAYMKLLFPHWKKSGDVDTEQFSRYCLEPAARMRGIIKKQLCIIDSEYKKYPMPEFTIKTTEKV